MKYTAGRVTARVGGLFQLNSADSLLSLSSLHSANVTLRQLPGWLKAPGEGENRDKGIRKYLLEVQ